MRPIIYSMMFCSIIGSALAFYPRGTLQFACSMSLLGVSAIFMITMMSMLLARARHDAMIQHRRMVMVASRPPFVVIIHKTIQ